MRVLLIEPPSPHTYGTVRILGSIGSHKANMAWAPYDLMIISGFFGKEGIPSRIVDANSLAMSWKEIEKIISEEAPEIVIFTVTVPTMENDVRIARLAKAVSKKIYTAAISLSIKMGREDFIARYPELDFVAVSEPEMPLLELVRNGYKPEGVRGIQYRINGITKENPPYPRITDLDIFGIPSQEKVPFKVYRDPLMKRRPMTIVNCSRGCSGVCTHCLSVFQRPLRYRSVENVIEELRLVQKLGIKEVKFFDCGLTNDIEWSNRLFEKMIDERFDITWNCNARADKLPLKTLQLMKKAGCHTICVGAESANAGILTLMKKRLEVRDIEEAVKNIGKTGIRFLLYFVLGLAGETRETIRETVDFAKRMDPDIVTFGIAVPVYGTPFYKYLIENGYLKEPDAGMYDPNNPPPYSYPGLDSTEIYALARKAYREFYLRPSYILKRFLSIRSVWDLRNNFENFVTFMRRYVGKK